MRRSRFTEEQTSYPLKSADQSDQHIQASMGEISPEPPVQALPCSAPVQSISGAVVPELLCLLPPRNSTDEEARNRSHRSFRSRSESRSPSRNSEPGDRNPPRTERRDWRPTALWSTMTLSFLVRKTIRMVSPRMR